MFYYMTGGMIFFLIAMLALAIVLIVLAIKTMVAIWNMSEYLGQVAARVDRGFEKQDSNLDAINRTLKSMSTKG